MPDLIIDNLPIQVPTGTKVIEAAERLGIMIPRFCYHVALGAVGACRLCAVKFMDGPVKGLQMSCMVEAQDGMVVSTTDAEAVDFRRQVIEWLMLHHPHDCPVCDEGGHCLLQDHTESSGHAIRRYRGPKRTHRDQYLGPLLQHEMNRCIQCYRCTRFYQEVAGYGDLGVMQIGNKVYFGRHCDGILQSPFAGNLADICPTGVFTDKPSRYMGRRWDYQRSPSVCINCSLGCNTMASARYREVVRQEARFNAAVNGHFICDRGRHGFTYTSAAQRPRDFRVDGQTVDEAFALQETAERLTEVARTHGLSAVACIGSFRSTLETQGAMLRLCREKRFQPPVFFDDDEQLTVVRTALAGQRSDLQISLRGIETSDAVLLVGCDPINEAPMLAMALRQAQRGGASIYCLDPRPVALPLAFEHISVTVAEMAAWLDDLNRRIPDPEAGFADGRRDGNDGLLVETLRALTRSRRPVIVCGTDAVDTNAIIQAGRLVRALARADRKAALFTVLPGANAFSAALLSADNRSIAQLVDDIEQDRVKAVLIVEADPFWGYCDRQRLADALARLQLAVVMDYLDGPHARDADIFLPSATIFETGGTIVNQEGRAQMASAALAGGVSIRIAGQGDHPPRIYDAGIPGIEPSPAWRMLSALTEGGGFADAADIRSWLGGQVAGFETLKAVNAFPAEGLSLLVDESAAALAFAPMRNHTRRAQSSPSDGMHLLTGELTFGSEELSCRSPQLIELEAAPQAVLSAMDAERLDLRDGDRISIDAGAGHIEIDLYVSSRMAAGALFLPRHRRLEWQRLSRRRVRLSDDRIRRVHR